MNITIEKFWHKYLNESIFDIFEDACDFFSQELPKEFLDNYDVGEVLLEVRGHHKTAKMFDKVITFSKLIRDKQPKLYKEFFSYFNDFLIDYYCFWGEYNKVEEYFADFIAEPCQNIDQYLMSYKKILFYQQISILDKAIIKNYKQIDDDHTIMGATAELAYVKYYMTLEDFYQQTLKQNYNQEKVAEKLANKLVAMEKYGFNIDKKAQTAMIANLTGQMSKDEMIKAFTDERNYFIVTLETYFLKYMEKKHFPFALSEKIWSYLLTFWRESNNEREGIALDKYLAVDSDHFERFIANLSGNFLIDNSSEMIAILWGSVYLYDFLNSIELIDDHAHKDFIKITKILKGKIIAQDLPDLWNSNFIHLWEKPDSISNNEFSEEKKIFEKSITLKRQKFAILREQITEELENIGELASYIAITQQSNTNPLRNNLLEMSPRNEPVTRQKKTGRNAPCPCGSGKKYKKCCG